MFSQRYERGSIIITSNLPFAEWPSVFRSERLTGALLDRLTHHVYILEMNGESYRLKQSVGRHKAAPSGRDRDGNDVSEHPAEPNRSAKNPTAPARRRTPPVTAQAARSLQRHLKARSRVAANGASLADFCAAPLAGYSAALDKLTDLLVVVDDLTGAAPGRRWAVLMQAKMAADDWGTCPRSALAELPLFCYAADIPDPRAIT